MSEIQIFDPDKLSIIEFKILKEQVNVPEEFQVNRVEGFQLENSLVLGFNLGENMVKSEFTIGIKTDSKGGNAIESEGSYHFVFIYKVENLNDFAKLNDNDLIDLHPILGNALSSITYSTSRGILFTCLQGTALQNFILPIIDPNKLL